LENRVRSMWLATMPGVIDRRTDSHYHTKRLQVVYSS